MMLVLPNELLCSVPSTSDQCFVSFQPIWCHPHTQIKIRGACSLWAEGGVVRREGDELPRSFLGSSLFVAPLLTYGFMNHVRQSSPEKSKGHLWWNPWSPRSRVRKRTWPCVGAANCWSSTRNRRAKKFDGMRRDPKIYHHLCHGWQVGTNEERWPRDLRRVRSGVAGHEGRWPLRVAQDGVGVPEGIRSPLWDREERLRPRADTLRGGK